MFWKLCAILVLLIGGLALWSAARADDFRQHYVPIEPPRPAPALVFQDENGNMVALSDFHGRYILVNLWATWCAPCRRELPSLSSLQNHFVMQRFSVLAITEDSSGITAARAFYARNGIDHLPLYADPAGRAPSAFHAHGLPTSILIDPAGMEIGLVEGEADWGSADAITFLAAKMTGYGTGTMK